MPDKLEKQIAFMKNKSLAFSFTSYQVVEEDGEKVVNVINAPKRMTYSSYLKNTIIGCLTVVIDIKKTGDILMPEIKLAEDMALWLKLLKKGFIAYGLDEELSKYRKTTNSLSANKLNAVKDVWKVYRDIEKLSYIYSLWCFSHYVFHAIRKRIL